DDVADQGVAGGRQHAGADQERDRPCSRDGGESGVDGAARRCRCKHENLNSKSETNLTDRNANVPNTPFETFFSSCLKFVSCFVLRGCFKTRFCTVEVWK